MEARLKRRIGLYLSHIMQSLILLQSLYSLYIADYSWGIGGLFGFALTLSPKVLKKRYKLNLPWEFNFLIALSLFIHVTGNMSGWYHLFYPFYDKVAHFVSSMLIASLGFFGSHSRHVHPSENNPTNGFVFRCNAYSSFRRVLGNNGVCL